VRFAAHHGFRPTSARPPTTQSKGIVENLVGYAKTDLMIPAPAGPATRSLTSGRRTPLPRCGVSRSNAAVHAEICAVPAERLLVERELLAPLPSLRAGIGRMGTRKVDRLACVRFGSERYSVPVRFIGRPGAPARRGRPDAVGHPPAPGTARWSPSTGWSRRATCRCSTIITAVRRPGVPRRAVRRKNRRGEGVLRAGPDRGGVHHRSCRGLEHPAGPRGWPSSTPWLPRTAPRCSSTRWPGRAARRAKSAWSRSVAGGPRTCGPSSPPAPQRPNPPRPGTRSCSSSPGSPTAHCRTIRPARHHAWDNHQHGRAGAGPRSRRRPAPGQARRYASTRAGTAAHREDPSGGHP